jgi:hypothetical protein
MFISQFIYPSIFLTILISIFIFAQKSFFAKENLPLNITSPFLSSAFNAIIDYNIHKSFDFDHISFFMKVGNIHQKSVYAFLQFDD